ncbi:unnamed protein product, partial [Sphacelaria rigidula]
MASGVFCHGNQSSTVRSYLSAIQQFHEMLTGWELPTRHCMLTAIYKGSDRIHGKGDVERIVRKPVTIDVLNANWPRSTASVEERIKRIGL